MWRRREAALAAWVAVWPAWSRAAEPGVSEREILIGQSAVLSGPLGLSLQMFNAGAALALADANARGGVGGRQVKLVSLDDELKPDLAQRNYRQLAQERGVFAFFGGVGSGTIAAVTPWLRDTGIPLVGNFAVADGVRQKARGAAYFVRAGYGREAEKLVQHLSTLGIERIAVAHLDNPGGVEVLSLVQQALTKRSGKDLLGAVPVGNDGSKLAQAVGTLAGLDPQAVVMFLSGPPVAQLMEGLWARGRNPTFYGMSTVAGEKVAAALGERLRGLAICQTMPYPWSGADPTARQFQQLCEHSRTPVSYTSFEGYLNALVLLEALRRCGKDPTRAGLHAVMRGFKGRIGGLDLDFSDDATGSRFVELVQVNAQGKFLR
ncbi:MAG: ABC transporter substrate-binding protein [Burkholderiales bacterium]|nr:ABC transporter substrate-binding protein [Burkholderiales bacterium]